MSDAHVTVGVFLLVLVSLTVFSASPDVVFFAAVVILAATGVLTVEEAFAGFGNPGLVTIGALFVVAEGLRQTGAVSFIGQRLLGQPRSLVAAQFRVMASSGVLSAVMNNTPVVAMMLPT